jgi:hypothetical protein
MNLLPYLLSASEPPAVLYRIALWLLIVSTILVSVGDSLPTVGVTDRRLQQRMTHLPCTSN